VRKKREAEPPDDEAAVDRAADRARLARVAEPLDARIAELCARGSMATSPRDRVRRRLVLAAAIAAADNAQSPVITSSDAWDYRRDRHVEGAAWERAWMRDILGEDGDGRRALLTNCGMAAVTTVLAFVERHTGEGPIVVAEDVYHETRHLLLTGALRRRVRIVASDELVTCALRDRADVVFVDAVSNTRDVRIADLGALTSRSVDTDTRPLVVIDTSVCSMSAPMVRASLRTASTRVIVVESLTKHAQLGLDRVSAGIIVADAEHAPVLDHLREHLGTNVADVACLLLPPPDRVALDQRLDRIARNSAIVAGALREGGFTVCHPSLGDHPDNARWLRLAPSCGLLTLPSEAPLEQWLANARAAGVALDHGAGFGFDVTRVYRTSRTVPEASEFVRVAPGTEPIDQIGELARMLRTGRADSVCGG
jgi:cystathionine beta-lyase/cystathionine gamma-synthase